jgi:hypothetical protein
VLFRSGLWCAGVRVMLRGCAGYGAWVCGLWCVGVRAMVRGCAGYGAWVCGLWCVGVLVMVRGCAGYGAWVCLGVCGLKLRYTRCDFLNVVRETELNL